MAYQVKGVEPAQNPVLASIERESGPSNFFRVMSHRPEAMQHFAKFYESLMGSGALLDGRLKEMIYLAVSFVNECSYSGAVHKRAALAAGISDQELHEIEVENNQHFPAREQAALHYARELTRTASVGDDLRYRVQELFSTDEYVELTMIVALANFTNRFTSGLAVSADITRAMG